VSQGPRRDFGKAMPNDLNELIAWLKANPNKESVGIGSTVRHLWAAPPRHRATVGRRRLEDKWLASRSTAPACGGAIKAVKSSNAAYCRLEDFGRIGTRYDKLARYFCQRLPRHRRVSGHELIESGSSQQVSGRLETRASRWSESSRAEFTPGPEALE
jgi:hypothetical protein